MLEATAGTAGLHTIYTGPASGLRRGGLPWEPDPREEDGDERPDPAVAGAEAGQPGTSRARPAVPAAGPRARGDRGRDLRARDRGGRGELPARGPAQGRRNRRPADLERPDHRG